MGTIQPSQWVYYAVILVFQRICSFIFKYTVEKCSVWHLLYLHVAFLAAASAKLKQQTTQKTRVYLSYGNLWFHLLIIFQALVRGSSKSKNI